MERELATLFDVHAGGHCGVRAGALWGAVLRAELLVCMQVHLFFQGKEVWCGAAEIPQHVCGCRPETYVVKGNLWCLCVFPKCSCGTKMMSTQAFVNSAQHARKPQDSTQHRRLCLAMHVYKPHDSTQLHPSLTRLQTRTTATTCQDDKGAHTYQAVQPLPGRASWPHASWGWMLCVL